MEETRIGRALRLLRQRRGWRQVDLAERASVSQSAVSDMERGRVDRYTVATIRRVLRAVDASTALHVVWGGTGDLDRLLDADHAALVTAWAQLHTAAGWQVWPEASYSIYGERGRIDLLAFHGPTRTLEVAEVKTGIWDVQDTIGRLDAKRRLAKTIAADRGWIPHRVVGALVLARSRTTQRALGAYAPLFAGYDARGRSAVAFVRDPRRSARGLLVQIALPSRGRRAGQQRVRRG